MLWQPLWRKHSRLSDWLYSQKQRPQKVEKSADDSKGPWLTEALENRTVNTFFFLRIFLTSYNNIIFASQSTYNCVYFLALVFWGAMTNKIQICLWSRLPTPYDLVWSRWMQSGDGDEWDGTDFLSDVIPSKIQAVIDPILILCTKSIYLQNEYKTTLSWIIFFYTYIHKYMHT